MPQFDFATFFPQIFWLLICFGVLYFFASRIILPRISSIIHARDGRINRNLNTAEKLQVKIDKLQIKSDKLRKKSTKIYNQTIQQTLAEASANTIIDTEAVDDLINFVKKSNQAIVAKLDGKKYQLIYKHVKEFEPIRFT